MIEAQLNNQVNALDAARALVNKRFAVLPVPHKQKGPTTAGWQHLRISESELTKHFNGQPANIGILTGEPSGWLVDIDLDHPQAVALARDYLPATEARFGRASKAESHWLYRVTRPITTRKFQSQTRTMIVEIRADGCQTIAPGSVHPNGEAVRWDADGEPREIDPDELIAAVERLACDVGEMIGEPLREIRPEQPPAVVPHQRTDDRREERCWRYIDKTPDAISGQGGHDCTFRAACETVRFDLDTAARWRVMRRFNTEKCRPMWSDGDLAHKLADAEREAGHERGIRLSEQLVSSIQSVAPTRQSISDEPVSQRERDAESWTIKLASQLSEGVAAEWIGPLPGILTPQCATLLSSLPKVGKTTWLADMIGRIDKADKTALVVSEEAEKHWKRRAEQHNYSDRVMFVCRPFKGKPSAQQWEAFISHVAAVKADVVVFDTLPNLWPCMSENDADAVIPSLAPLVEIMEAGAALFLLHHAGKSDKSEGRAARGSNSLVAWVDIALELRRAQPDDPHDRCRIINGWGRFDEVPAELVIEMTDDGYRALGEVREVRHHRRLEAIADVLARRGGSVWLTIDGVKEEWPEDVNPPSDRQLRNDLAEGWRKGLWRRQGMGKRNDPFMFSCNPDSARKDERTDPLCFPAALEKAAAGNKTMGVSCNLKKGAETSLQETDDVMEGGIPI